jgi:hydrogenase/urease accessory protein HupE
MRGSKQMLKIAAMQSCGFLIAVLVASPCWAHPGHGVGGGDWSLRHHLTEPDHLAVALGLALLFAGPFVWRAIRVRRPTRAR